MTRLGQSFKLLLTYNEKPKRTNLKLKRRRPRREQEDDDAEKSDVESTN